MMHQSDGYWGEFSLESSSSSSSQLNESSNRAWPYLVSKNYLDELKCGSHHSSDAIQCRLQLSQFDTFTEQTQPGPLSTEKDFFDSETQYTIDLLALQQTLKENIENMRRKQIAIDPPELPVRRVKSNCLASVSSSTSGIVHSSTKYAMLRKICAGTLMLAGFTDAEQQTLDILVDVLERYLQQFSRSLKNNRDEALDIAGSSFTTDTYLKCVESTFSDFGITSLEQLIQWYPVNVTQVQRNTENLVKSLLIEHADWRTKCLQNFKSKPIKMEESIDYFDTNQNDDIFVDFKLGKNTTNPLINTHSHAFDGLDVPFDIAISEGSDSPTSDS